jgi:hypothetical protein
VNVAKVLVCRHRLNSYARDDVAVAAARRHRELGIFYNLR